MLQIGSDQAWLWIDLVAESFLRTLIKIYPQACSYLGLKHLFHSPFELSIVERTTEYLKDRTEAFDDCYPCMKAGLCSLKRIHKWRYLFDFMYHTTSGRYSF
jgi:hypothetical protein